MLFKCRLLERERDSLAVQRLRIHCQRFVLFLLITDA